MTSYVLHNGSFRGTATGTALLRPLPRTRPTIYCLLHECRIYAQYKLYVFMVYVRGLVQTLAHSFGDIYTSREKHEIWRTEIVNILPESAYPWALLLNDGSSLDSRLSTASLSLIPCSCYMCSTLLKCTRLCIIPLD
ncbi:hypothetical protein J6590_039225 [Homalodisca vitripennis]|nr:hypothetical protein J6590_039225 [Homalodisca vitripennis]